MSAPTTGEPGQTGGAQLQQLPVHLQVTVFYLALVVKVVVVALRDVVVAKVCAWFLSIFGLHGYPIPIFTVCHLCLFLFGQSSWRKAAITLRRFIGRDDADDELMVQLSTETVDLVCYVSISLVFRNMGVVWSLGVRGFWTLCSVIEFITPTVILWFWIVDNPRDEAIRALIFTVLIIAMVWDFARPKILAIIQSLWQLLDTTIHRCVRLYVETRARLIAYRDRRTVEITTALEEYKYSALKPGQIRLLKLSKWTLASPVFCELVHVRLDGAPEFETISYTWGTQRVFKRLILNGRFFDVSERVYEVVHDRASSFMTRLIWIDSICINQCDNDEKNIQVRLMKEIYNSSCHTVIWLGHAPDANEAMAFLALLDLRMHFDDPNRRASLPLNKLNIDSPAWPSLVNLINHDYWTRYWIYQEVAVSKKVIISYGGELITWDYFSSVMKHLFHNDPNSVWHISKVITRMGYLIPPCDAGLRIVHLGNLRNIVQQNQSIKLFDILISCITCTATDPRDSIFALQGISLEAQSGDLVPDYNSALEQTFLKTAEYLLRQEYPSRILHMAGIGYYRNSKLQISWVPDWSTPRLSRFYWRYPTDSPYRSSAIVDELPRMLLGREGLTLTVPGIRVDRIQKLGPPFFGTSENGVINTSLFPRENQNFIETRNIALRGARSETYPTGIPLVEAYWRTLIGDRTPTGTRPAQASFVIYYQAAERFMDMLSKFGLDKNLPSIDLSPEAQEAIGSFAQGGVIDVGRFMNVFGPHMRERRLAITDQGYMGVVPPYSEIGDVLFIIPGTQVPFLLRSQRGGENSGEASTGEEWRLVGESYLHGMMDGEAMKRGGTEEQLEIY